MKGCLNGKSVSVLRDTGATTIFVSDRIISKEQIGMNKKEVTLANGDTQFCPEVNLCIESPYISGIIDALVLNNPFADVVIGNIDNVYPGAGEKCESIQVITRSMAKKNEYDEQEQVRMDLKWKADEPEKEHN